MAAGAGGDWSEAKERSIGDVVEDRWYSERGEGAFVTRFKLAGGGARL